MEPVNRKNPDLAEPPEPHTGWNREPAEPRTGANREPDEPTE